MRCINIDCVFNSSNDSSRSRNTCSHPNLIIESKFADITIAICSEFRSKKDYSFEKPDTLIEIKTNSEIVITGAPDPTKPQTETITTKELEESVNDSSKDEEIPSQVPIIEPLTEKPFIISEREAREQLLAETYRLTSDTSTDFLVLNRLYQNFLKQGVIYSVISHVLIIWLLFVVFVKKDETNQQTESPRIVIVEDIETPKFDPPDMDKKEEPEQIKDEDNSNVRPKITPKTIVPKIKRPKDNKDDIDSSTVTKNDSTKRILDSLLALKNKGDTNRYIIPDSIRSSFAENEVGMNIDYPKNWSVIDARKFQPEKPFYGVMLGLDSADADYQNLSMSILIDDPKYKTFNKTTYKNRFEMTDSTYETYSTDPITTGGSRISYKHYIFVDNTGTKNISVSTEVKQAIFEKYKPIIDAIIRSIRIVKKPDTPDGK